MTKPENPYPAHLSAAAIGWDEGYAAGLRDGEKRLARALRRWLNRIRAEDDRYITVAEYKRWLSARLKERK